MAKVVLRVDWFGPDGTLHRAGSYDNFDDALVAALPSSATVGGKQVDPAAEAKKDEKVASGPTSVGEPIPAKPATGKPTSSASVKKVDQSDDDD